MPIYEYECQKCGEVFEVRQSFSDDPITKCVSCNGKVKKLFSPPAIIFKGSGFHCNDYKSNGGPRKTSCPAKEAGESSCGGSETSCPAAESCAEKAAAS